MENFTDIYISGTEDRIFCYRSGKTVYEETLTNGKLVASGWNGAGFTQNVLDDMPARLNHSLFMEPQAFDFEAGGRSMAYGWGYEDFKTERYTNENNVEVIRGTLILKSSVCPIRVRIITSLDGTEIITRHIEIENISDDQIVLNRVSPISGGMETIPEWRGYLPQGEGEDIYSLGYMENDTWGREGAFKWHKLPEAGYSVYGRYLADRHRHPMFILKNNALGTVFTCQLAWSAGYSFDFNFNAGGGESLLSYKVRLDGPAPFIVLEAFETYITPAVHIGMIFGDTDCAVNTMHDHMRKSVFVLPPAKGVYGWLEAGMGPERLMDIKATKHFADTAAMVGAETMVIDAGWYCPLGTECAEWWARTGDWYPDKDRYPEGISEIRDYIHNKGLLFGLWLDIERIGHRSEIFAKHPDWVMKDGKGEPTTLLDMADPKVAKWVENELARVITDYKLDLFRLDYNISNREIFCYIKNRGKDECCAARYYTAVYGIYERLRKRFPDVIFENCAGGGGRTDIGLVSKFTHTWVSDWQVAPRSAMITNGMTMALPPERVDRLVSGMNSHTRASLDFMTRHTLFGRPTTNDYNAVGSEFNSEQIEFIRHTFDIYKNFIRPFARDGKIFHHTPDINGIHPNGNMVIERASKEGDRGVIGIFRLSGEVKNESIVVYPRGIDISGRYEITYDNRRQTAAADGYSIANDGIRINLGGTLTSELILYRKINLC